MVTPTPPGPPLRSPPTPGAPKDAPAPDYTELQVTTNFSFLRGASHPEELALTAAALGHRALAITDRNSLAGVVRAHLACQEVGLRLVVGARLDLTDGPSLLCLPTDRAAYGRLSRLITLGRRRAPKGHCHIGIADVIAHADGQVLIAVSPDPDGLDAPDPAHPDATSKEDPLPVPMPLDEAGFAQKLTDLAGQLPDPSRLHLALSHRYRGDDAKRLARLSALADGLGLATVATNDVHYHSPARRPLQDVVTCIRTGLTIEQAGLRLAANAERALKPAVEMVRLFRFYPDAVSRTGQIVAACQFSLTDLSYNYPEEVASDGETPQQTLVRLTWAGAARRYPEGIDPKVRAQLTHELQLIDQLAYAPYFLTVEDIVRYARSQNILCQGRGSAANSAVCYVLGITAVDPTRCDLLFERFVSAARNEPPDIDVDFEHERREEVIQYIYRKYGRDRAGLTATVICYRGRGAIREVGKALGLSEDTVDKLAKSLWGWGSEGIDDAHVIEAGLDPTDRRLRQAMVLAREIQGFPRHLSQHVGGFVISRGPLTELVPVENAAMEDRTVIEWDKDDLDALKILKIDVLALGMLSCVSRAFDLMARHYGRPLTLATVPAEDRTVYDMLCRADSLGVFQVESRAQMSMLPRLKPRAFYDLVIEVAIVRPGPIQGDMVHPYLRRRSGEEPVVYPSGELRAVLQKTLGVPLFQEQAMKIAIVGAGFSPSEADRLRRAMATFKKVGDIHKFHDKMVQGMIDRGYDVEFAERCFKQIEGFGTYGFPESHAASFALLVYVSSWIKCHYPDVFCAALLNSQPMGFYAPAQIVRDAREHGVTILPPDINRSDWDCTLEPAPPSSRPHAVRLGLRQVKGLGEVEATRLVAARAAGGLFRDVGDVWRRAGVTAAVLDRLAGADTFRSIGLDRRQAAWAVKALGDHPLPLFAGLEGEAPAEDITAAHALPTMPLSEHVVQDYGAISLTVKRHPVAFLRPRLRAQNYQVCEVLGRLRDRSRAAVAGLVLVRQRPGSAKGVIFITLEDETGVANLVIMPPVFQTHRKLVLQARLVGAIGRVEIVSTVIHLKVDRLVDLTDWLGDLREGAETQHGPLAPQSVGDRFAGSLARADEVARPTPDLRGIKKRQKVTLQKARSFR